MGQRRRRQRMPLTERRQSLRPKRRQKNKENILAYNCTEIKSKLWCFSLYHKLFTAHKEEFPPCRIKEISKNPTSPGHISIEYLDDEVTVFWAINKKVYTQKKKKNITKKKKKKKKKKS